MPPNAEEELRLRSAGHLRIAGLDEVGRGCWAGPVFAAAIVLPQQALADSRVLAGVDDSKLLSAPQREALFERITALTDDWAIGAAPAHIVDSHGILAATRLAMQIALLQLPAPADALLIDAVRLEGWPCSQVPLIKGDSRSLTIAAASVLAKVARDRAMAALGRAYPDYGFESHKGYGTAAHFAALRRHGPTPLHRRTFRPIAEYVGSGSWPRDAAEHTLV